jgi:hypothetical protein
MVTIITVANSRGAINININVGVTIIDDDSTIMMIRGKWR